MAALFREQEPDIPDRNFIIEPGPKDSGPAAGLGLAHISRDDPDGTIAILSADHYIGRVDTFLGALRSADALARQGPIVTLGIAPAHPSTGFGYIERGESLGVHGGCEAYRAARFTEKPSRPVAEEWLAGGRHVWNSGMFILACRTGWREFERQQPRFSACLRELSAAVDTPGYPAALDQAWQAAEKKSLDYTIMEGAERMAVIPVDMQWTDIGSWASLLEVMAGDEDGNVIVADHVGIGTRGSLVRGGGRLVATIGLDGVVIVDTPDALLVCSMSRAQDVKELVDRLKQAGRADVL
jgi:mannose-1-phosphate guanylyltransferase/mannose-6-phosphate isomerase